MAGAQVKQYTDIAHLPHKAKLLKGKWQLKRTFTEGRAHTIPKDEYDGVYVFKCFHRYMEEVQYEGYHWIIKGKWKMPKNSPTLILTKRKYVIGALEKAPEELPFTILQLDKEQLRLKGTAKGADVEVEYNRLSKQ